MLALLLLLLLHSLIVVISCGWEIKFETKIIITADICACVFVYSHPCDINVVDEHRTKIKFQSRYLRIIFRDVKLEIKIRAVEEFEMRLGIVFAIKTSH